MTNSARHRRFVTRIRQEVQPSPVLRNSIRSLLEEPAGSSHHAGFYTNIERVVHHDHPSNDEYLQQGLYAARQRLRQFGSSVIKLGDTVAFQKTDTHIYVAFSLQDEDELRHMQYAMRELGHMKADNTLPYVYAELSLNGLRKSAGGLRKAGQHLVGDIETPRQREQYYVKDPRIVVQTLCSQ